MAEREAFSVTGVPCGAQGEDSVHYEVGRKYPRPGLVANSYQMFGPVTRITVSDDLPGLHCHMERVRVYDGETLIYEAPLHNLEGVAYPAPNKPA